MPGGGGCQGGGSPRFLFKKHISCMPELSVETAGISEVDIDAIFGVGSGFDEDGHAIKTKIRERKTCISYCWQANE